MDFLPCFFISRDWIFCFFSRELNSNTSEGFFKPERDLRLYCFVFFGENLNIMELFYL